MAFLMDLFAEKLDVDDRVPFVTFELSRLGYTGGVLPPKLMWWLQLATILLSGFAISTFVAVIVYKLIVQRVGTTTAYLTGFGFVIPFAASVPFFFLHYLDIRSKTLSMALIIFPLTGVLRCLEAMFGYTPPSPNASLRNYCFYYGSMMDAVFDPKKQEPVMVTIEYLTLLVRDYLLHLVVLMFLFSAMIPVSFAPFETRVEAHSIDHTIWEFLDMGHLLNNFLAALLTSITLSYSTLGVSILVGILWRVQVARVVDNPMLQSNSPSNFWGRRWNTLIHGGLKRGVFLPMRNYFSKPVAAAGAFVASGIIHEYVWAILFFVHESRKDEYGHCSTCFYPIYGKSMVFFGWNGAIIMLEYIVGGFWIFHWMRRTLPTPVVTMLVIMTALPVGHLFTGDWIAGDYFTHMSLGFPIILLSKA